LESTIWVGCRLSKSLETQRRVKLAASSKSLKTQCRVKLAASSVSSLLDKDKDKYNVACCNTNDVLLALLDANPRECNAVIVVCTLTLSSKMLVQQEKRHPHPRHPQHREGVGVMQRSGGGGKYVTSLIRTLCVLDKQYASHSGALSFRQLCNAAWLIARHLKHHRSHSSSYSSSSIISLIGRRRKELILGRRYCVPGSRGTTMTATTTT
jgi:hypothetical protein